MWDQKRLFYMFPFCQYNILDVIFCFQRHGDDDSSMMMKTIHDKSPSLRLIRQLREITEKQKALDEVSLPLRPKSKFFGELNLQRIYFSVIICKKSMNSKINHSFSDLVVMIEHVQLLHSIIKMTALHLVKGTSKVLSFSFGALSFDTVDGNLYVKTGSSVYHVKV